MTWPSFTHPGLLAGLLAVGLPVLVHFLTRARPRRIPFPTYHFLSEACAGRQALHRLRTYLVLALRTFAVAGLVLMFSRPFVPPEGAAAQGETGPRRTVLLIDASLSMRAAPGGVSLFARARAEAADVLRGLESGSEAAVILAGAHPRSLLPALSRNLPALHSQLVSAAPTFELGNPEAALALARKLLNGPGQLFVFSDFQESNWRGIRELPPGITPHLRPSGAETVHNLAVTRLRASPPAPVVGEACEIIASIANFTSSPRQETVRLELEDLTQEATVSVPAFGSADALFSIVFPAPGVKTGQASIPPDDLIEDNVRHLAVRVGQARRAVVISDSDPSEAASGARFVQLALAPTANPGKGLWVERRHSQEADRGVLETADAFFVVAPALLPSEVVEILQRRVSEGAELVVFLDTPTGASLVLPGLNPPFQLGPTTQAAAGDAVSPGARILFPDIDAADWRTLRVHRHYAATVPPGRTNEVLLTYPDGAPALTFQRMGAGSVAFANVPLSLEAGNLVASPLFPALLHELIRLGQSDSGERSVSPGGALALEAATVGEARLAVTGPGGTPVAAEVTSRGRTTHLVVAGVGNPGPYVARVDDRAVGAAVVNVDPLESDPRPIRLEGLKAADGRPVHVARDGEELESAGRARPLWPGLAMAAIACLGVEMLVLAFWRQGFRNRAAAATGKEAHP
jgi:hypothetical protein